MTTFQNEFEAYNQSQRIQTLHWLFIIQNEKKEDSL